MNYPKKIPSHKIQKFDVSTALLNSEVKCIRAFYHYLFPANRHILGMHAHSFYEINIVLKGNTAHYMNDQMIISPVGSVFVIPPDVQHGYYSENDAVIFQLVLTDKFFSKYFSYLNSLSNYHFIFKIEPLLRKKTDINLTLSLDDSELKYIHPILERLCQYDDAPRKETFIAQEFLALNLIAEICILSNTITEEHKEIPHNVRAIIKAMEYINLHYTENINFHILAKTCNISYSTFFRTFKNISHNTPVQYLSKCRIEKAIDMMMENKYTHTEIAQTCGFYDSSHFTKMFKALMGKSPKLFFR